MPKKVKIAFIGSGGMAHAHAPCLAKLSGVELVAFCDVVAEKARHVAAQYGGAGFTSAARMLNATEPDGVYICLPPFAHGKAEMACVERRVPFFIEKPINKDVKQAAKIAAAVEDAGLMTSVGYMNRYRKGVNDLKRLLESDPAVYVQGGWIGGAPRPPAGDTSIMSWWIQKDKSGGQFVEQVTHTVDLVRYLCGEAASVSAYAARGFNRNMPAAYDIEDALAVSMQMANGGVVCLHSCCASEAFGGVSLSVYATKVAGIFGGWNHDVTIYRAGREAKHIVGEGDVFTIEDKAFVNAVRIGDPSGIRCTYADGLETLRITVAAGKSAQTGKPVKVQ